MKTSLPLLALALFLGAHNSSHGAIDAFGLEHFPIGAAVVYTNEFGQLRVEDIETNGMEGVATWLGAADSGAFIFPTTDYLSDGFFIRGHIYGSFGGRTNSLLGIVAGRRADYATFYVTADYTMIGATSLTFQTWRGNVMLREETTTNNSAEIKIYAENSQSPRVNPWSVLPDGARGMMVNLSATSLIYPVNCTEGTECEGVWADKFVIRPNQLTNTVDYVSRTDVFGGGGLPKFAYNNYAIGMFGHPHTSLGSAKFVATNGVLTATGLSQGDELVNGVHVDFDYVSTANLSLLPVEIGVPNTNVWQERLEVSASGATYGYVDYLGSAWLQNSNGALSISAATGNGDYPQEFTLIVYSNTVPVGSHVFSNTVPVSLSGAPRLIGTGARANTATSFAGITFDFDRFASFEMPGGSLPGNRVLVSVAPGLPVSHIESVAFRAAAIPDITITGESSTSSIPSLQITRAGNNITLSWPDSARAYRPLSRQTFSDAWQDVVADIVYVDGIASLSLDASISPSQFFILLFSPYGD